MKYATCQEPIRMTVLKPAREIVTVKCGLPSAPDHNGLCVDCENRIHEMNERHAEALEMDADPLRGKDGGYGPNTGWGLYLRRCEKARRERFDVASNGGAW
jgi:hypothetical protein